MLYYSMKWDPPFCNSENHNDNGQESPNRLESTKTIMVQRYKIVQNQQWILNHGSVVHRLYILYINVISRKPSQNNNQSLLLCLRPPSPLPKGSAGGIMFLGPSVRPAFSILRYLKNHLRWHLEDAVAFMLIVMFFVIHRKSVKVNEWNMWRPNSRLARIRKDEDYHPNHQDHPNQPNHPNHPNRKKDRLKGNRGRRKRNEASTRVSISRTRMGELADGVYFEKMHSKALNTLWR